MKFATEKQLKARLNYEEATTKVLEATVLGDVSQDSSDLEIASAQRLKLFLQIPRGIDDFIEDRCADEFDHFERESYATKTAALAALKDHHYYYYAFIRRLLSTTDESMSLTEECRKAINESDVEIRNDPDR